MSNTTTRQREDNTPSTRRKRETGCSHLVENPWALGIHQETKKRGKFTQDQKGQNWFCIKLTLFFFSLAQKINKIKMYIFNKIIV